MDLLFDILEIKATCITFNLATYKRIYGLLLSKGYTKEVHPKNTYLEKEGANYKVQLTYNSKIKKHTFHFFFYPPFDITNADKFIKDYFKKYICEDITNYSLKIAGNTEVTLDLKNFDVRFIENLQTAVNKLRKADKYYSHTKINNAFVKLYLKEKRIRLETKVGNGSYNPLQVIKEILDVKIDLLDDENRRELYFEYIFNSLLKIEETLEKLTENQTTLTNIVNAIPTFLELLQNLINQRFEETYLQHQDTQKSLDLMARNQNLLIQLIEKRTIEINDRITIGTQDTEKGLDLMASNQKLLIDVIEKRFEEVSNKIETESRNTAILIKESGFGFKIKHFLKELYRKLKRK
jgi:hypothetical protein